MRRTSENLGESHFNMIFSRIERNTVARLSTRQSCPETHFMVKSRMEKFYEGYVTVCKLIRRYSRHIFWLALYCYITAGVFAYKFGKTFF